MADGTRETVKRDMATLTCTSLPFAALLEVDDVDPFTNIEEDEQELEENEIILEDC